MYSLQYQVTTSACDSEGRLKLFSALDVLAGEAFIGVLPGNLHVLLFADNFTEVFPQDVDVFGNHDPDQVFSYLFHDFASCREEVVSTLTYLFY